MRRLYSIMCSRQSVVVGLVAVAAELEAAWNDRLPARVAVRQIEASAMSTAMGPRARMAARRAAPAARLVSRRALSN